MVRIVTVVCGYFFLFLLSCFLCVVFDISSGFPVSFCCLLVLCLCLCFQFCFYLVVTMLYSMVAVSIALCLVFVFSALLLSSANIVSPVSSISLVMVGTFYFYMLCGYFVLLLLFLAVLVCFLLFLHFCSLPGSLLVRGLSTMLVLALGTLRVLCIGLLCCPLVWTVLFFFPRLCSHCLCWFVSFWTWLRPWFLVSLWESVVVVTSPGLLLVCLWSPLCMCIFLSLLVGLPVFPLFPSLGVVVF